MSDSTKYPRTMHSQISLGSTSDDRIFSSNYVQAFADMKKLILTEKLDGQNNSFSKPGVFARSHAEITNHPWDKPMRERWELIKNDLGDLEIFVEGMYGIHSIAYSKLESYCYVFAVRENDTWLSWEEVKNYATLFDFPTVPEIEIKFPLSKFLQKGIDENRALENWLTANLGMTWRESVETAGLLGGYDPKTEKPCSEGFVIRNADSFKTNDGTIQVAENEFNNIFKIVREKHVKTEDKHWQKTWKKATLIDYSKYNWHSYEFLKQM